MRHFLRLLTILTMAAAISLVQLGPTVAAQPTHTKQESTQSVEQRLKKLCF